MTFIIHFKDGHRETYSNHYDENDEHERDAAWDDVYVAFPDADYEAGVVNPKVSKCFQALMDALNEQLDSYRSK